MKSYDNLDLALIMSGCRYEKEVYLAVRLLKQEEEAGVSVNLNFLRKISNSRIKNLFL